jgi:hypothetical protein
MLQDDMIETHIEKENDFENKKNVKKCLDCEKRFAVKNQINYAII